MKEWFEHQTLQILKIHFSLPVKQKNIGILIRLSKTCLNSARLECTMVSNNANWTSWCDRFFLIKYFCSYVYTVKNERDINLCKNTISTSPSFPASLRRACLITRPWSASEVACWKLPASSSSSSSSQLSWFNSLVAVRLDIFSIQSMVFESKSFNRARSGIFKKERILETRFWLCERLLCCRVNMELSTAVHRCPSVKTHNI